MVLADRIRAVKYDSSFLTVKTSGIKSRVDEAGNRDPCFARRSNAGSHRGSWGRGGERYRDNRMLYTEGEMSSVDVDALRGIEATAVAGLVLST